MGYKKRDFLFGRLTDVSIHLDVFLMNNYLPW